MANIQGASLGPIYERLNGAPNYHPLEADTFADWSMESGDIVTVTRDGQSYASPVHHTSMTWRKGQKISVSSTGNKERGGISKLSQKKYNRGSSGLRNTGYTHWSINDKYDQMRAGLELTESSALLYVNSKYNEMGTGLRLTESTALLYAYSKYNEMGTGLSLTASSAILYASSKYSEMSTGLKLTASSAVLYASNKYSEMTAGLKLTASSAVLYATNKYSEMSTGLRLTASTAVLYASSKYSEMTSGLKLTASSAVLYASNKYSEMSAGLRLTSSTAVLYATNKYAEMKTGLSLSTSSAVLYASSKYSEMTSGLKLTASSAVLYAQSRTTRAYIMTRINANGEGEALIEADKIKLSGNTTLAGALNVISGGIAATGNIQAGLSGGNYIRGTSLKLIGSSSSQGAQETTLSYGDVDGMIIKAEVDGDELKLWTHGNSTSGDPQITFEKASTISGSWSGGVFTASAGSNSFTTTLVQGSTSWSNASATVDIDAIDSDNPNYQYSTGRSILVTVSISDAETKSVDSNVTGGVQIRSKISSGATGNYRTLGMYSGTYTPQGVSGNHPCVVVKDGNTIVGRYDIQSTCNDEYKRGWNECHAAFLANGETLYRVKSYTITPSDIGHVFNVTDGSVYAYTVDPGTK